MLSHAEETGLRNILSDVSDEDLFSIFKTFTKNLVDIASNRFDAINVIISFCNKPCDLLGRMRITKKILFTYLLKMKCFVSPESSKAQLIDMCLQVWKSDILNHRTKEVEETDHSIEKKEDWLYEMGLQFSQWFFPMLNKLDDFGPHHFWGDCKLMGEMRDNFNVDTIAVDGSTNVANSLLQMITVNKFYFHAHCKSNGILCEQDNHGLVKVMVSGVVHQNANCVGLFDCGFGLVNNPSNEKWLIKTIGLKIHINVSQSNPYLMAC